MMLAAKILGGILLAAWILPVLFYFTAWWWMKVDHFFSARGITVGGNPHRR